MMKDVRMTGTSEEDADSQNMLKTKRSPVWQWVKVITPEDLDDIYKEAEDCASMEEYKKIEKELKKKMRSEEMMEQGLDAIEVE